MASATLREQCAAALQSRGSACVYASHIKVYEYADANAPSSANKTRYIILGHTPDRRSAALYKAKRNTNGSFSIGKDWDLATLHELELQPDAFIRVTLARTYRWQADQAQDPTEFLTAVARTFQALRGALPVCKGWNFSAQHTPMPPASTASSTRPASPLAAPAMANSTSTLGAPTSAPAAPKPEHALPMPDMLAHAVPQPALPAAPAPQPLSTSGTPLPARWAAASDAAAPAPAATPTAAPPYAASGHAPSPALSPPGHASSAASEHAARSVLDTRRPSATLPDPLAVSLPAHDARRGLTRPPAAFPPTAAESAAARRSGKEHATLTHVEEMLEGFEWKGGTLALDVHATGMPGGRGKVGTADVIEARLLEELAALESSNIHAMIESDDRVNQVLRSMDDALHYLDYLDINVSNYKAQLNARAEDIAFIEGQNRGLQVQTSNQRVLLQEIQVMLASDNVDNETVRQLSTVDVESASDVSQLESAAATLYKSILQTRPDNQSRHGGTELAAMTERLRQYETIADQFGARLLRGIAGVFEREASATLVDAHELRQTAAPNATLPPQERMEQAAGKYCGLMLYMKETSPACFEQLSAVYLRTAAHLYHVKLQRVFTAWRQQLAHEEAHAQARRGAPREKSLLGPNRGTETLPWEALQRVFAALVARVQDEQAFLSDLLHINDTHLTFADYMDLEPHYRHRATITTPIASTSTAANMTRALEQVFAALTPELESFATSVGSADRIHVVGMLAETERVVRETAPRPSGEFFAHALGKVLARMHAEFARLVDEQIHSIEQTKLSRKKRKGIVPFTRAFPAFVRRVEAQLVDADDLGVRNTVNDAYERIGRVLFSMLQSMSNTGVAGVDEDKGQLNHYVILIENMYHIQTRVRPGTPANPTLARLQEQAQGIYAHALNGYVQSVLRRALGKMSDFCTGIDALLQTTPANEVTLHSAYSKSAAKKLVREHTAKDLRKAVEALSKRVQKHFTEDDDGGLSHTSASLEREESAEVLAQVWRASEDAFARETERFLRILKTCYNDALHPDYTMQDVRRPFHMTPPAVRKK